MEVGWQFYGQNRTQVERNHKKTNNQSEDDWKINTKLYLLK